MLTTGPHPQPIALLILAALSCCPSCAPTATGVAALTQAAGAGWTVVGALQEGRELHRAAIIDADGRPRVLLIGGRSAAGNALASVESYDLTSHVVTSVAPMAAGRWGHTVTPLSDGTLLVVGGFTAQGPSASVERYDPTTNRWSPGPALTGPRFRHAALALPTTGALQVLVVGGQATTAGPQLASVERLKPGPGQHWLPAGALSQGRADHRATLLIDGRVLISGGEGPTGVLASTQLCNPQNLTWTPGPLLSAARRGHGEARLQDGSVLIVGGESAAVDLFTTAPDRALTLSGLAQARRGPTLTAIAGNKAVLVGGLGSGGAAEHFAAVHVFDGATRTWDIHDSTLNQGRRNHRTTLLETGRILISGGRDQSGMLNALELSKVYGVPAAVGDAGVHDGQVTADGDGQDATGGGDGNTADAGCGCTTSGQHSHGGALVLLVLLVLLRRTGGLHSPGSVRQTDRRSD